MELEADVARAKEVRQGRVDRIELGPNKADGEAHRRGTPRSLDKYPQATQRLGAQRPGHHNVSPTSSTVSAEPGGIPEVRGIHEVLEVLLRDSAHIVGQA